MKMKKSILLAQVLALLVLVQLVISPAASAASKLSDGTYKIDYVITKAENDSVSMANDYFEKPAALTVKNGVVTAQIQLNHSKWITEFTTALGGSYPAAKVVKSDEAKDTRIAQFTIEDLSKPLLSKIHVTVPDIDYDHDYTIRFIFDEKTAKATGKTAAAGTKKPAKETSSSASSTVKASNSGKQQASASQGKAEENSGSQAAEANPKTGDESPIAALVMALLLSGICLTGFAVAMVRARNRQKAAS